MQIWGGDGPEHICNKKSLLSVAPCRRALRSRQEQMEKGGLQWKQCPGRAGSILAEELLPLLMAASGPGSGSWAPVLSPQPPWASQCKGK